VLLVLPFLKVVGIDSRCTLFLYNQKQPVGGSTDAWYSTPLAKVGIMSQFAWRLVAKEEAKHGAVKGWTEKILPHTPPVTCEVYITHIPLIRVSR